MKYLLLVFLVFFCTAVTSEECIEEKMSYFTDILRRGIDDARRWKYPKNNRYFEGFNRTNPEEFGTFDFIIVGAGSAGAVLARRLTDTYPWKVLLLEAGGNETDFSMVPKMYIDNLRSDRNWGYKTVPQTHACKGMVNNQCDFPRGKSLGGSSGNNAMFYIRGHKKDFDEWRKLVKSKKWSYENLLPYFKKIETSEVPRRNLKYRGDHGPIFVTLPTPLRDIFNDIIKGNNELGLETLDYNAAKQMGAGQMQSSIKDGRRDSTNRAYLQPIMGTRDNLSVLTNALVTKIIMKGNVSTGVEFLYNAKTYRAMHTKELILSAGAINTPQLLMLSGIGPKEQLQKFKIPVIADLPVGKNLEDHLSLFLTATTNITRPVYEPSQAIKDYIVKKSGPLTTMNAQSLSYYVNDTKSDIPDTEILYVPGPFSEYSETVMTYNFDTRKILKVFPALTEAYTLVLQIVLLHPASVGQVTLQSANPLDFPLIDPNYLIKPIDSLKFYQAITYLQRLFETNALHNSKIKLFEPSLPECNPLKRKDMQLYWNCVMSYLASTLYHPTCTCRMGLNRKESVVNKNLRIHGLKKIRIIDASVVPKATSGHMNAVVIMMAEKMATELSLRYAPKG